MNRIVSSTMVGIAIEAGELFGVPRDEMVALLPDPSILNKPWQRLEWDIFVKLMRLALQSKESAEEWIEAGRIYKRERYDLRSAHLYAQFKSWERAFWVTKHLLVNRIIQGYSMEYKKLDDGYFWFEIRLPDHLQPFPEFLYFSIGVWSGSSKQANLQNQLRNVQMHSHHATAELLFDGRSLTSKVAYNPLFSRWKTHKELKKSIQAEKNAILNLEKETYNLRQALAVIHDAVFLVQEHTINDRPFKAHQSKESASLPAGTSTIHTLLPTWLISPEASIQSLRKSHENNIQIRDELESRRDRKRKIFDAVSDIVLVYHFGEAVLMNQQAVDFMKSQNDQAEEVQTLIYQHSAKVLRGEPYAFTFREDTPEQRMLLIRSCVPFELDEGKGLLITLLDLTATHTLIQKLREDAHDEKTRIRRDLHDGLSQCLASLALQSKAISLLHSDNPSYSSLQLLQTLTHRCVHLHAGVYHTLPEQ